MLKFLALLWALRRYRTKKYLFRYIRKNTFKPPSQEYLTFIKAYEEIERDFKDVRRESGAPYMTHIHAVVVIVVVHLQSESLNEILAALFHDSIEHFEDRWSFERIRWEYNPVLARFVLHLTKLSVAFFTSEADRDFMYHKSFKLLEIEVARVKIADRIANNLTLFFCSIEKQFRKISETIELYLGWAKERGIMYHELRIATKIASILLWIATKVSRTKTPLRSA